MTMTTNVGRRSCPPVLTTWCTFWLCSGRSSSPLSPRQSTGMAGHVSSSPSSWLAYLRLSLETSLPTLAAPSAWRIPWLRWCLSRLEPQCQVGNTCYVIASEMEALSPSWPFCSCSFKGCANKPSRWKTKAQSYAWCHCHHIVMAFLKVRKLVSVIMLTVYRSQRACLPVQREQTDLMARLIGQLPITVRTLKNTAAESSLRTKFLSSMYLVKFGWSTHCIWWVV